MAGAPETLTYAYQTQSNLLAISPNPNVISHSNITGAHAEHQLEQTVDGAARFMTAEQVAILYTQMSEHAQLLLQVFLMAKTRTCRKLAEPVIYEVCDTSRHLISELLTVRDYRMLQATEQQQRQTNAPMDKNAAPDILSPLCRPPFSLSRTKVLWRRKGHFFGDPMETSPWAPTIITPMVTVLDVPCLIFAPELLANHSWLMPSNSTTEQWKEKVKSAGVQADKYGFVSTVELMPFVPRYLTAASLTYFNLALLPQLKDRELVCWPASHKLYPV